MNDDTRQAESLLPYEAWTDDALRQVVARALAHAAERGLPGEHHFYLTFQTDHPGVTLPGHLKARYPQEMTVVLQHRFWDLKVERDRFSVGLSFGGVPSTLVIPFAALTAFADPQVRFGLRFQATECDAAVSVPVAAAPVPLPAPARPETPVPAAAEEPAEAAQVVSLDAFRRRPARE